MAERRMFAKTIVTSDAFLDMPLSARCLYFTLGMFADDDGFVNNPKSIMRQVGASSDDLNVLLLKKFIISFETGVIVIKHWRINNYLRSDRYCETKYVDEKKQLTLDKNGAYVLGIPMVDQMDTQYSIGKDSIGYIKEKEVKEKESTYSDSSRSLSLTNTQSENETNTDNVSISFDNAPIGEHSSSNNNNAVTCDIEDPVADAVEYSMKSIKMELDRYIMELFDKTWAIYPRKVSKEQAKKTWAKKMKCCKTPQGVRNKAAQIYKLLMSHIAMWRNEHGDDGEGARPLEYIPHFSSWLNNEIPDD